MNENITKIMRQSMLEGVSSFGVKAIVPERDSNCASEKTEPPKDKK